MDDPIGGGDEPSNICALLVEKKSVNGERISVREIEWVQKAPRATLYLSRIGGVMGSAAQIDIGLGSRVIPSFTGYKTRSASRPPSVLSMTYSDPSISCSGWSVVTEIRMFMDRLTGCNLGGIVLHFPPEFLLFGSLRYYHA